VSPRTAASRTDATARQFLTAAATLIDAYLSEHPQDRVPRLRSIRFPAALDWLRTEDVIRLVARTGLPGASRSAFFNRWPTKDEFLADALVYTLLYEDEIGPDPGDPDVFLKQAVGAAAHGVGTWLVQASEALLVELARYPRSYLITHIACLLSQHPVLWDAVAPTVQRHHDAWAAVYTDLIEGLGVVLRPGWTPYRLQLALQAVLDGFLIRQRLQPDDYPSSGCKGLGVYADTVAAFILGVVDTDRTGETARAALDRVLTTQPPPRSP